MENSTSPQQSVQKKWYDKTWLVVILCIFFFPVGLYALWKNESISKGWKIGVTAFIVIAVLAQIGKNKDSKSTDKATTTETSSSSQNEVKEEKQKVIGVGDVLKTNYFEIVVNKVSLEESVNTGNQFADLKAEDGNLYLIINASFKNTDNESRMLSDGSVWINYNGKDYEYDKTETVMLKGWGIILDQINPLTTKTTNLVYKIPTEIKGDAYWQPGRASSDERILLGNLK